MGSMMRNLPAEQRLSRESFHDRDAENRETVQKPLTAYVLSKGMQGLSSNLSVRDLAKWADEGEQIVLFCDSYSSTPKLKCSMISTYY